MELILAFAAGAVVCLILVAAAMRRAKSKPDGKTARAITSMGGGGPRDPK